MRLVTTYQLLPIKRSVCTTISCTCCSSIVQHASTFLSFEVLRDLATQFSGESSVFTPPHALVCPHPLSCGIQPLEQWEQETVCAVCVCRSSAGRSKRSVVTVEFSHTASCIAHRCSCAPCCATDDYADHESAAQQEQQGAFTYAHIAENLEWLDANQLQTALSTAIAAEDYTLAAAIRDRLAALTAGDDGGGQASKLLDWQAMGVHDWVADRAGRLGLRFPTGEGRARRCLFPFRWLSSACKRQAVRGHFVERIWGWQCYILACELPSACMRV